MNMHDNIIDSYTVNLKENYINVVTSKENRTIVICFSDVLAHYFENELNGSIILDICLENTESFIQQNKSILSERRGYNWPTNYKSLDELLCFLNYEGYKYYNIYASYGLSGWILAKNISLEKL